MILAQNTFTVKRLVTEFDMVFSSETMAIPATSSGVADLTNAEFSVKVSKDGKELFPDFDWSFNLFPTDPAMWENGYWNATTGGNYTNADYRKTKPDVTIRNVAGQTLVVAGGLTGKLTIVQYNAGGTNGYTQRNLPVAYQIKDDTDFLRLYIEATDDGLYHTVLMHCYIAPILTPHNCSAAIVGDKIKITSLTPGSNSGYVDVTVSYGDEFTATKRFTWALAKQGDTGTQGVPGAKGADGQTTYTWIRYADTATGTGISNSPTGKLYIGFAYNKTTATESSTPSDYAWSLIKGADGEDGGQGVPGAKGADGITYYTWIKYSDNADGTALYDTPTATTKYIGIAVNKTTPTESTTKTDYTWSKFRGDDGVSISNVDVEFAVNTSATVAPTTGWVTTAPALTGTQQLWTRTKTTYSTGDPTYTTAVNITPKTGAEGTGIDSIIEEFYLSTSKTTQTGGAWVPTPPAWENGKYIWTRIKVTYKNPKSTEYTTPQVSSEWEAVNDLEFGGRNLLLNSGFLRDTANWVLGEKVSRDTGVTFNGVNSVLSNQSGLSAVSPRGLRQYIPIDLNDNTKKYTGSLYVSTDDLSTLDDTLRLEIWACNSSRTRISQLQTLIISLEENYVWKRYITVVNKNSIPDEAAYIEFFPFTRMNGRVYFACPKFEKGNKPTDWSPAPEDVQAEITRVETETKTKFETTDTKIQANVTAITSTQNSVTGLTTRVSATESQLTVQAGQISAKVSQTDYNANNVAINNSISQVNVRAGNIELSVSNLKIGTNLLINSNIPKTGTAYNIGYFNATRDFVVGETLTITIKGNIPGSRLFGLWFNSGSIATGSIPKVGDRLYSGQITVPAGTNTRQVGLYLVGNQTAGDSWEFEWITLQSGNIKIYEWEPSSEDVTSKLLATGINIENKKITLTADNTIFQSNAGQQVAIFNANWTKIQAAAIELEGLVTVNSKFKVLLDGSIEATDGEFTGKITTEIGVIGGFEIGKGRIGRVQSGGDPINDGMSLYDSFIKFSDSSASVFLGTNVLPGVSGTSAMMRMTDNRTGSADKRGAIISVSGSSTKGLSGENENIAIDIPHGVINGLRLQTKSLYLNSSSNIYLDKSAIFYTVAPSANGGTIHLPSNRETGDIIYLYVVNNFSVIVQSQSPYYIKYGYNNTLSTVGIGGSATAYPGSKAFFFDGTYWCMLSI